MSLSCMAIFSWNVSGVPPIRRWSRSMSCREQETKKYCCASLSLLPISGSSFGIEHFGHRLRDDLFIHRPVIVPHIEFLKVERLHRLRLPEAQGIAGVDPVPDDGRVIGRSFYFQAGNPAHAITTLIVVIPLRTSAPFHMVGDLRPVYLPGVAQAEPLVATPPPASHPE